MSARIPVIPTWILACMAAILAAPVSASAQGGAGQSAAIVNYQRFGEDNYPATSIPIEQFDSHIAELTSGRYFVRSVDEIVTGVFSGDNLGNRTVGLTVDDAYRSFYELAWPRLRNANLPFTLFVSTDPIDQGLPGFMSWDQIRELHKAGVTIGAHTASHPHLLDLPESETRREIEISVARIESEIGVRPKLFSYPHGESSAAVSALVSEFGFTAGFGQHSGTVNPTLDRMFLPRFSMNGAYGALPEFRMRVDTLAFPVRDLTPADPLISGANPPAITFTVDPDVGRIKRVNCYYSQFDDPFVEVPTISVGERRYKVMFENAFREGPWRLNCTMPTGGKRWRWFGMQYYTRTR